MHGYAVGCLGSSQKAVFLPFYVALELLSSFVFDIPLISNQGPQYLKAGAHQPFCMSAKNEQAPLAFAAHIPNTPCMHACKRIQRHANACKQTHACKGIQMKHMCACKRMHATHTCKRTHANRMHANASMKDRSRRGNTLRLRRRSG